MVTTKMLVVVAPRDKYVMQHWTETVPGTVDSQVCMWLTLVWSIWVPRCPKLDSEERGPADCVDQHDDKSHSHRLGHGFSDARRRSGRTVRLDVVEGAPGWACGQLIRRMRLLAVWAVRCLLLCGWCCDRSFTAATVILNSSGYVVVTLSCLAVMGVIERIVIYTL